MAGIYSQGGSAGHRYAGWLSSVEAKNFQFGGKVFNGSPSAIYVGSNLVWTYWLKHAAMQAIMDAFGVSDGTAVINATNQYLNQLAASDRDKATALAGFINEDPMMVCSLGLEPQGVTMPHRYLIGDGTSYLRTSVLIKTNSVFAIEFYNAASSISGYPGLFGSGTTWNATNAAWLGLPENAYGKVALWINGGDWPNCVTGTVYSNYSDILECTDIKISGFKCKNLTTGATSTASSGKTSIQGTVPMQIFGYSSNGTSVANKGFAIAYWQHIGDTNNRLLPIILGKARTADQVYPSSKGAQAVGTKGMIDIETGLFHPNANSSGSFTIGYKKYQNGSWVTWTPSTP